MWFLCRLLGVAGFISFMATFSLSIDMLENTSDCYPENLVNARCAT